MSIPCLLGGPSRGERPKVDILVKMVEFRGIPAILVEFTKKTPETAFLVKIHLKRTFTEQDP